MNFRIKKKKKVSVKSKVFAKHWILQPVLYLGASEFDIT